MPAKAERADAAVRLSQEALMHDRRPKLRPVLADVVKDLWASQVDMSTVAELEALQQVELRIRGSSKEKAREIEAVAKIEIGKRMRQKTAHWKSAFSKVKALNKFKALGESDEED